MPHLTERYLWSSALFSSLDGLNHVRKKKRMVWAQESQLDHCVPETKSQFSSVAQSCPPNLQHAGLPIQHQLPELTQTHVHWIGDAIQPSHPSSVVPFSSCPQTFPASGSFPISQLFTSGGQSIGVSASISNLPMNTQDWSPLGWTGWISLQANGLSRVFSKTTV